MVGNYKGQRGRFVKIKENHTQNNLTPGCDSLFWKIKTHLNLTNHSKIRVAYLYHRYQKKDCHTLASRYKSITTKECVY